MELKKAFPLIIAVACGILALVLLNIYINNREQEIRQNLEYQLKQNQPKAIPSLKKTGIVLTAKQAISPQVPITAADISIQQLPKERINPAAAVSLQEVLGYVSNKTIPKGRQILKTQLISLKSKEAEKPYILVPQGKKAISIFIENFSNIVNIIQPGNYVDVFAVIPSSTKISLLENFKSDGAGFITFSLFQNIKVFAIGEDYDSGGKTYTRGEKKRKITDNQTVSLILNTQEIKVLSFIQSQNGRITLALRGMEGTKENSLEPIDWDFLFKYLKKRPRTTVEIYRGSKKEVVPLIPKEDAE